ncbi:MAG: POT family MFS transporter [Bacteriovoracaceae bacterium]|nr:POT family MFS transporter [Bacteriovoracaceae bacterium]
MSQTVAQKFPPQIKYIVGNEGAERYSFYGMRSILVVFMVQYLLFQESDSISVFHLFVSACYFTPLLGAFIADRLWGKYKTILYLSLFYCLGHAILAIWENKTGMYWGLFFIALGAGGIKPCVSAHVGDQFVKGQEGMLRKVFDIFYWMINFGSTFSTIITPYMLHKYGPGWAFGVPGILMAIATWIFWLGRKQYVHVPPTKDDHTSGKMLWSAICNFTKRDKSKGLLGGAYLKHPADKIEELKGVGQVARVYIGIILFWALFDQHASTWILQAEQMDLNFLGIQLLASQIQTLNPILVMCMIPLFALVIYPMVEKVTGKPFTPLKKMGTGMFLAAASFVPAAIIQYRLDAGVQMSVGWQFFQYFLITASELMVSIVGLEFSYTQAPRSMKSTMMSIFFLTIVAGNFLTSIIAKINVFQGGHFYSFFALLTLAFAFLFLWLASSYKERNYMEV